MKFTIANDSGATTSTWMSEAVPSFDAEIPADACPDVCVIGAGIAGLSVALTLVQDGFDVLVIDQGPIGGGQTARTSAHLSSALDDRFYLLEKRFGKDGARLAADSHASAIDAIETNARTFGIDCDFRRVDGYLFAPAGKSRKELGRERDAARRAGLVVDDVDRAPLPFDTGPCLRFGNQAQFHPLAYVRGLADAVIAGGGRIVNGVHVVGVSGGKHVEIETRDGRKLHAAAAVDTTDTTITSRVNMPTRDASYRSYVVAFDVAPGYVTNGLFWDTEEPYHYIRVAPGENGREVLIVGGEDHRVGQGDPEQAFPMLETWARAHFPAAGETIAQWSGQIMEPADGLAYIGALPGESNVFISTGDSGHGLTHGTIAGLLIPALIQEQEHPWAKLYAPNRSRRRGAMTFVKEAISSSAPYADWLAGGDVSSVDQIMPGHGATIRRGLHLVAAYRDEAGTCHTKSARCPHMSGAVRWNEVEKTWDCPCHGSRFDAYGRVLNGPAQVDLPEAPVSVDKPQHVLPGHKLPKLA
jgi:glycine/D-amino acid oxidase-like deaminating enzyme/nitrite reductase/ring-hydroxylating ferredoxin subunit